MDLGGKPGKSKGWVMLMYSMVISYILFGMAFISFYLFMQMMRPENRKQRGNFCVGLMLFTSSMWSFCYSMMFVQRDIEAARIWRAIGQYGVFAFFVLVIILASRWANISATFKKVMYGFTIILAIPLAIITGSSECATFFVENNNMYYRLLSGVWNNLYTTYCIIICFFLYFIIWCMLRQGKRKKERAMGKKLLWCANITVVGMVFDTIMPQFGYLAFPGSTLGQFFGAIQLYNTIRFYNKSQLTIENMSEFVYSSVKEPLLVYDNNKKLLIVNETGKNFFGLPENFEDMTLGSLFDVADQEFYSTEQKTEIEAICRNNSAYCNVSTVPILDEYKESIGFLVLVNNLTEKMHMISELEQERKRADAANEAKSRVLAQISHEIRTPINAVLGMDEMILRESDSAEIRRYAEDINSAGKTLLNLINEILDFSKIESGNMEIVEKEYNLLKLVRDVRNVLVPKAEGKGLNFSVELEEGLPYELYGDDIRVKQIITNLINNAIKYTEKGDVWLYLKAGERTADKMQLIIQVKDTGIGIKEEDKQRLFQAFNRVNEAKNHNIEGTGLGLSIVRQLAELMNGSTRVESEFGKGSMFEAIVEQKVVSEKTVHGNDALAKWEAGQAEKRVVKEHFTAEKARILVVDDTAINLTVVKALLKRIKVQVDTASSGRECIEKATRTAYHIIFMDHMMPEMDGIETLEKLRSETINASENATIIVLTANAIVGSKDMFLKKGFDDYMSKPIDGEVLESMVEKYLPDEIID